MLLGLLDLEKVTVNDLMIPRNEIEGIDLDDELEVIVEQLRTTSPPACRSTATTSTRSKGSCTCARSRAC